jgi:hypothetical protein
LLVTNATNSCSFRPRESTKGSSFVKISEINSGSAILKIELKLGNLTKDGYIAVERVKTWKNLATSR